MSIRYVCPCGASYKINNDLAGQMVRCPKCRAKGRVPENIDSSPSQTSHHLLFSRHKFLLRARHDPNSEKYSICDEQGMELLHVERPARMLASTMAVAAAVLSAAGMGGGLLVAQPYFSSVIEKNLFGFVAAGLALLSFLTVFLKLRPNRSIGVYTDLTKSLPLFFIRRNKTNFFLNATYDIEDPDGRLIAMLKKNYLLNLFGKRWVILRPGSRKWAVAKKRNTNFVISNYGTKEDLGIYNRNEIFFGRCLLDMSSDSQYEVDRRVALSLGIVLDTAEHW